jgi:hypothetical protein
LPSDEISKFRPTDHDAQHSSADREAEAKAIFTRLAIQTLIDNHVNAFNTQNIELFHGVFRRHRHHH